MDYELFSNVLAGIASRSRQMGLSANEIVPHTDQEAAYSFADSTFFAIVVLCRAEDPGIEGYVTITGGAARGLRDDFSLYREIACAGDGQPRTMADATVTVANRWGIMLSLLNQDPDITGKCFFFTISYYGSQAREMGEKLVKTHGGRLIDGRADDGLHLYR
jgi:hypothetical protein